jgi:hypothetical protein
MAMTPDQVVGHKVTHFGNVGHRQPKSIAQTTAEDQ